MGDTEAIINIYCHKVMIPVSGIELQQTELLAKEVIWKPLNNLGYCQDYRLFALHKQTAGSHCLRQHP